MAEHDDDVPEQMRVRRAKLDRIREAGGDPYPVSVARTHTLAEIRQKYPELEADVSTGDKVSVAGRIIFIRNTGKLCFATLREGDGVELQAMLSLDKVGEESLASWKADIDLGDQVLVEGEVITSRRGELSVLADRWRLTAKALRPLPVAHKPLSEEARVRQRYVDLIVRPEAQRMVRMRSAATHAVRSTLVNRGFIEVETPMLQAVQGGATARPFTTHYNAFDSDVYLRIALELHLKRCLVGGIDKVYEIGRVLRNEGSDSTHNPEFTMVEAYEAYSDYNGMADLTREVYQAAAREIYGSTTVARLDGSEIDFGGEWPSISLYAAVSQGVGEEITPETPLEEVRRHAERHGSSVHPLWSAGRIVQEMLEDVCQDMLSGPVFVRDYPLSESPLTRVHRSDPRVAEKWDLYVSGVEVATAYSELNDPVDQRERLLAQVAEAAAGDPEAMQLDEDFLLALEYGMPPAGGLGFGIDRMLQAFTGRGLRETILFPFVRSE